MGPTSARVPRAYNNLKTVYFKETRRLFLGESIRGAFAENGAIGANIVWALQ